MSNGYTEAEKMMFAPFVMLEVAAMQADNEICKADSRTPKFDGRDFGKAVEYANRRMRESW
jgi:hypothetical protein